MQLLLAVFMHKTKIKEKIFSRHSGGKMCCCTLGN